MVTGDHVEQRCLVGAVLSDDAEDLAQPCGGGAPLQCARQSGPLC